MPHDRDELDPDQTERLHRKIERLISGQPAPVLDGDTEDLAEVARLLNASLPRDIPDPAFREQLRKDLLDPGPRLVSFRPRRRPQRYPIVAAGAVALMVAAAASATMLVIRDGGGQSQNMLLAATTPTMPAGVTAVYAAASATAEDIAGIEEPGSVEPTADSDTAPIPPAGPTEPPPAEPTAEEREQLAAPADSTRVQAVVDLPPVDRRHVELGALATVAADVPEQPDITYVLGGELPDLERAALAYRFSTPHFDSQLILRSVRDFLGIEPVADIQEQRGRQGRTVYTLSSAETGASFTWTPTSGAFACTLPPAQSTAEVADLSERAIEWLTEFGYPVGPGARPVIETKETGERFVHVSLGDGRVPDPVIGHPMRITLVVDPEGRIVRVSGYWLEVTDEEEVPLMTAEQAWSSLVAGAGYWPDETAPRSAGQFVVTEFSVRYMLTTDDQSDDLVLQPVIAASGTFTPSDGSTPYRTTVYLQAAAQV